MSEETNDVIVEEADLDEAAVAVEPEAEGVESEDVEAGDAEAGDAEAGDAEGEDVDADGAPRSKKASVLETEGEIAADYLEDDRFATLLFYVAAGSAVLTFVVSGRDRPDGPGGREHRHGARDRLSPCARAGNSTRDARCRRHWRLVTAFW